MTYSFAPWAVDGAETGAYMARRASFAAMDNGAEGIIQRGGLRVIPLSPAGNGVRITEGDAAILNRYQTSPNETYIIANRGEHTVLPGSMPTSQPVAKSYLVLTTVGDGDFSQVGHPWMPSDPLDPEDAADFEYVRPWLVECPAGTTHFKQLGLNYPAYASARIDIPANTTTITDAMITDLRTLARPRSERHVLSGYPPTLEELHLAAFGDFMLYQPDISIPDWATHVSVLCHISGLNARNDASGMLRAHIGTIAGSQIAYGEAAVFNQRFSTLLPVLGDVSAMAGTTVKLKTQGYGGHGANVGKFLWASSTFITYDVQFYERAI